MKNLFRLLASVLLGVSVVVSQALTNFPTNGRVGLWKFDDGANLGKADVGNALLMKHTSNAANGVNKFVAITGPQTGDGAVTVGLGSYFECTPDLLPNGADTAKNVNRYTIAMDIRFPKKEWHAMFKFDPATTPVGTEYKFTNDADIFYANSTNNGAISALGTAQSGYTYDTTGLNQWYRLVVTADLGQKDYKIFLDGQLALQGKTSGMSLDNRYSIRSIDGLNKLIFFGDDDGDDGEMDVAFIALYNRPISPDTVALMGGFGHAIRNLAPIAQWDFEDNGSPLKATTGTNLSIVGKDSSVAGPKDIDKARAIGNGSYYVAKSTIYPNGNVGAARSNLYAIKIDFRVKSFSAVHPLFQTDTTNANSSELYVSNTGTIGNKEIGYSTDAIATGKWQRLVINANLNKFFDLWLDGKRLKQAGSQTIDGRYSLSSIGSIKSLLLFADSAAYAGSYIDVASISLWNRALDSAQIFTLGVVPIAAVDTSRDKNAGYAIYTDGTSSNPYVRIDSHADFKFDSTKAFSIEVWTKANQAWSGDPAIISNKDWGSGNNVGWAIVADAGRKNTFKFNIADEFRNRTDINFDSDSSAYLGDNKWHHIVITVNRKDTIAKAYIDGKLLRTVSVAALHGSVDHPTYPICLAQDGTTKYSYGYNYGGYIDEVRIWKGVALDSTTIQTWRTKTVTSAHPNWSNLVGYWNFDEGTGTSSVDKSGKNHTALLVNNVEWRTSQAALPVAQTKQSVPANYELANAYPNPFNPSTVISYQLPVASKVGLRIYDLLGREVATLVNEEQPAGTHNFQFSILNYQLSSGVYFYRIDVTGSNNEHFTDTKKLMLVK